MESGSPGSANKTVIHLIQYKILLTKRFVWQTVQKITVGILGVEGLTFQSVIYSQVNKG